MESLMRQAVKDVLKEIGIDGVDFVVEHPSDINYGDYTCNVAMVAFKGRRAFEKAIDGDSDTVNVKFGVEITNPRVLAEKIKERLNGKIEGVKEIKVEGPGFINFYLSRDFFSEKITQIHNEGENWGKNEEEKGEVVLIEYTSPNLFKPLHVGNLVGNIIGESLTRLYEFSGADVKRMNYPSDIGLPVAKAVWGLIKTGNNPTDIEELGEAYRFGNAAYEKEGEEKEEIISINQKLYAGSDAELSALRVAGIKTSKDRINELCEMLGTHFDKEIFESEASGLGANIVNENLGKIFEESNGAVIYKGEKVGLHTRVFLNSKGLPTYEAKDIGHFTLKSAAYPEWTQSIIVTGGEQAEYFKVVFAVLKELFPEIEKKKLEHIPTGFLTLTTGKMSSRTGNVLTGESLLAEMVEAAHERATESRTDDIDVLTNQVAVAALKHQILRHGVGSNIVFDKAKSLSFEGDSGPYIQYTNARINSVLVKAKEAGIESYTTHAPEIPYEIEKILYRFPEVIVEARSERAPHKVVTYLTELASMFNSFYAQEKIADANDEYAPYKAAVAKAVGLTLKNGLWVLGIESPEKM